MEPFSEDDLNMEYQFHERNIKKALGELEALGESESVERAMLYYDIVQMAQVAALCFDTFHGGSALDPRLKKRREQWKAFRGRLLERLIEEAPLDWWERENPQREPGAVEERTSTLI